MKPPTRTPARRRPDRSRSTAPTKRARRLENWGPGSDMPPTSQRRAAFPDHRPPSSPHAQVDGPWLGAHGGGTPPRKRTAAWRRKRARRLARTNWRAFYARRGIFKPAPTDGEVS